MIQWCQKILKSFCSLWSIFFRINKSLLLLCYQGDLARSCRMSPITRLHHRAGCHRLHGFTTELPTSKNSLQALSQCHAARNIHIQAHATGHNTLPPTPWSQALNHHNLNWVCQLTHTHTQTRLIRPCQGLVRKQFLLHTCHKQNEWYQIQFKVNP